MQRFLSNVIHELEETQLSSTARMRRFICSFLYKVMILSVLRFAAWPLRTGTSHSEDRRTPHLLICFAQSPQRSRKESSEPPAVVIVVGGKRAISASSQPKKKLQLIRGKDLEKRITGR
jgi:hypothetical protein